MGGRSLYGLKRQYTYRVELMVLRLQCPEIQICTTVPAMSARIDLGTRVQLVHMQRRLRRRGHPFLAMHCLCTRQVQGHTGIYMYTMSCRHVFEPRTIRLYAMCPGQDRISRQENLQRMPRRHGDRDERNLSQLFNWVLL